MINTINSRRLASSLISRAVRGVAAKSRNGIGGDYTRHMGSSPNGDHGNERDDLSVSIVYGSFTPSSNAMRDAWSIHETISRSPLITVSEPTSGEDFDFDSLLAATNGTRSLIVSSSSCFGMPPPNITPFLRRLLELLPSSSHSSEDEQTDPQPLRHIRHGVWGLGDPRWYKTYMNVPRHVDKILEQCGSTRFAVRGESVVGDVGGGMGYRAVEGEDEDESRGGEPHVELSSLSASEWAERALYGVCVGMDRTGRPKMMGGLLPSGGKSESEIIPSWDDLWKVHPPRHHSECSGFALEDLIAASSQRSSTGRGNVR